jgi:hypothetical protein
MKNPAAKERAVAAKGLHKLLGNVDRPEFGYKELALMILGQKEESTFDSEDFLGGVLSKEEIDILKRLVYHEEGHRRGYGNSDFVDQDGDYDSGPPRPGDPEWDEYARQERARSDYWEERRREREERWERGEQTPEDERMRDDYEQQRQRDRRQSEEARKAYERNSDRIQNRWKIMAVVDSLKNTVRTVTIRRTEGFSDAFVVAADGETVSFGVPVTDSKLGYKVLSINQLLEDDFIGLNPELFDRRKWEF